MQGETNLKTLIRHMKPILHDGAYVFATVSDIERIPRGVPICEIKEEEGTTVILLKEEAIALQLHYEFVASRITLMIHSALEAVGLTAAIATELAKHDISCNVVAGYYHDHLFVGVKDAQRVMEVLHHMAKNF